MQKKFLSVWSLALLQVIIVGNIQILPANASLGFSIPFIYFLAIIGFFIPCVLMSAELATTRPQTGGAYIWCEQAFGPRVGFFNMAFCWLSSLLWYPSIFSLIAANIAYLFDPTLAFKKSYIVSTGLILFWLFTALNCAGVRLSTRVSTICSLVGILFPMTILIVGGIYWCLSGRPLGVSLEQTPIIPDMFHYSNVCFLISVVISFYGIEITGVHAGDVVDPRRDYPRSLFISSITLVVLLVASQMAIAIILPYAKENLFTGALDGITYFFQEVNLSKMVLPVLFLVLLGSMGSVSAWMLASTRGMQIACQRNQVAKFLQKTNRHGSPVGVLLFEAVLITFVSSVYLIFPDLQDSVWLLLDLASQVTLLYYIILFVCAIRLRYLPKIADGYVVPGKNWVLWLVMGLGIATCTLALCLGFFAPAHLNKHGVFIFHEVLIIGLAIACLLPLAILYFD